jgi:oligopeptide/dipeptide ABC transporter ATP-binding protein
MSVPLITVSRVFKEFPSKASFSLQPKSRLVAVDNVSFHINQGETLGLVGESGCGKTTLAKLICCLEKPSSGEIRWREQSLTKLKPAPLRYLRKHFQPVFQDPFSSLNPRFTVFDTLSEALRLFSFSADVESVKQLLARVGLGEELIYRYPHQLSGGQRQRLGIARALSVQPELLIADEPLSSLDVSVQAQILNLFLDLQQNLGLTMLFISHDLRVVSHLADNIVVMYLGRVMESAETSHFFQNPRHPYSWALLEALPKLEPGRNRNRYRLPGEPATPINPQPGCRFYSRCPFHQPSCRVYENELLPVSPSQQVACLRWKELGFTEGQPVT